MIQVNRIYLIFNRLVTKKFLMDTSERGYIKILHGFYFSDKRTEEQEKNMFFCSSA